MRGRRRDADADDDDESDDGLESDVRRLRRLMRDAVERQHESSKRIESLETKLLQISPASGGVGARTTETEVQVAWLSDEESRSNKDWLSSDARKGIRATHEVRVGFEEPGGGELTARCASTRADYLANDDEFESRVVTLEKVKYSRTIKVDDGKGIRVRAYVVPFGAEGVDAAPGGVGGSRRSHQLTGFGAYGSNLIERCNTDSMASLSVEYKNKFAAHVGVFTGNRQPEDDMGKVLAQLSAKSSTSTRHVNAALNVSRCQSGETVVGGALTFAKTLPKTTRAIVTNAWAQTAATQKNSREDLLEWGLAANLPPTHGSSVAKNAGWGVVLGKPANRGGVQAEAFLRLGSDGEEAGATLIPGVVFSTDDRGNRSTSFACRAHWLW